MFRRFSSWVVLLMLPIAAAGCGPSYSPDTYASNAAQQANKVDPGVVVGVRRVGISASGTVGTVTGAAAGGIAGSQAANGPISAFTALGGSLIGGIAGSTVEHATADTEAYEYIIRKPNGDLLSVTQKDKTPLLLGQKVLVIAGNQARVVIDYTAVDDVGASRPKDTPKADGSAAVNPPVPGAAPGSAAPVGEAPPQGDTASKPDLAPSPCEDCK